MFVRTHFLAGLGATAGGLLLFTAACSESPTRTGPSPITAKSGGPSNVVLGQPEFNQMEVCKEYSGIVGPPVTITVQVDVGDNNSIDQTLSPITNLGNGQCREIAYSSDVNAPVGDRIILTEQVPAGYTASFTREHTSGATSSGSGNVASGVIHVDGGYLITFINTSIPTVIGTGRFTGGGWTEIASGLRISQGLTIHCDLILSNNLEINWKDANDVQHQFHMTEHLTTIACTDSASIPQPPPAAPLDTLIGTGTGKFDGTAGFTVEFTLVDSGEPGGANDQIALRIFQGANVVLNVPLQDITKGNLQAHFDQPHK